MNENRDDLRAKHSPDLIQDCRVEAVMECEDGVLEARTSTGEIFAVIPTEGETLKLPEAGDDVRLYLGEGPGGPGLVVGVDINGEFVYYEPPAPEEISSPSETDVAAFDGLWASWGSLTSQESEVARFALAHKRLYARVHLWRRKIRSLKGPSICRNRIVMDLPRFVCSIISANLTARRGKGVQESVQRGSRNRRGPYTLRQIT